MAAARTVIIGNGPAANQAALTLREQAPDRPVTMLGKERERFYRPDRLPAFVTGALAEEDLYVHPHTYYKELGVQLRLGQEVVSVDFEARELLLDHKEIISFDGLIIATGGRPRVPEPLHQYGELLLTLKTLADAKVWKQRLEDASSVLLIGGDLTSLSFARALLSLEKRVHFVVDEDAFWPVRFSPEIGNEIVDRLENRGVTVLRGRKIAALRRGGRGAIELETNAETVKVDLVGAFFGLMPDVRFVERSGLHIERGILVDEHLQTPFPGVYAAGDCAQVYHPELRDYWVSIGFKNAKNLGRTAALNLLGMEAEARAAAESILRVEGIAVNTSWWAEF